ncbi:MAG: hypothetical protein ACYC5H_10040 [Methylovirgula sp.]
MFRFANTLSDRLVTAVRKEIHHPATFRSAPLIEHLRGNPRQWPRKAGCASGADFAVPNQFSILIYLHAKLKTGVERRACFIQARRIGF